MNVHVRPTIVVKFPDVHKQIKLSASRMPKNRNSHVFPTKNRSKKRRGRLRTNQLDSAGRNPPDQKRALHTDHSSKPSDPGRAAETVIHELDEVQTQELRNREKIFRDYQDMLDEQIKRSCFKIIEIVVGIFNQEAQKLSSVRSEFLNWKLHTDEYDQYHLLTSGMAMKAIVQAKLVSSLGSIILVIPEIFETTEPDLETKLLLQEWDGRARDMKDISTVEEFGEQWSVNRTLLECEQIASEAQSFRDQFLYTVLRQRQEVNLDSSELLKEDTDDLSRLLTKDSSHISPEINEVTGVSVPETGTDAGQRILSCEDVLDKSIDAVSFPPLEHGGTEAKKSDILTRLEFPRMKVKTRGRPDPSMFEYEREESSNEAVRDHLAGKWIFKDAHLFELWRQIFPTASQKDKSSDMTWGDFVSVMTSEPLRFEVKSSQSGGVDCHFIRPPLDDKEQMSIVLHKPHGNGLFQRNFLWTIKSRLRRRFGWSAEDFKLDNRPHVE